MSSVDENVKENDLLKSLSFRMPTIPLAFLGLGVYRAWIEIGFVGSFVPYPDAGFATHDLFDMALAAMLLIWAALSRRTGPFFQKRWLFALCCATMTLSTCAMFCSLWLPGHALLLEAAGALLGGVGTSVMILMWSELYGCLNPLRVALYYSCSILVGAIVVYVYRGFQFPWLFVMTAILPAVALFAFHRSFGKVPEPERPSSSWVSFSVPWRAILLMACYAFAYGTLEPTLYGSGMFGAHSAPGTVLVALVVLVGVTLQGRKFDFNIIYKMGLPLMVAAFLLIPIFGYSGTVVSNVCVAGAYTGLSILIMLICANICYRYGVSAVWLFGIERGVRLLCMFAGRQLAAAGHAFAVGAASGDMAVAFLAIAAVVMGSFVFLSTRDFGGTWGATFLDGGTEDAELLRKQEIADRCNAVATEHGLTARETEVLLLLAQKKTVSAIEEELFIANGTAKAHVRHIYQKIGIHSREELFDVLGIDGLSPIS
ncbi:helix-turn-helix transcriptional regulator [Slackia heliotrinireducens]|uniref:helix-turn-helix transcriptional regulator n=1 Tax=Slackia heliotrinireducens TaxID=84110 RepID=UPI0033158660